MLIINVLNMNIKYNKGEKGLLHVLQLSLGADLLSTVETEVLLGMSTSKALGTWEILISKTEPPGRI